MKPTLSGFGKHPLIHLLRKDRFHLGPPVAFEQIVLSDTRWLQIGSGQLQTPTLCFCKLRNPPPHTGGRKSLLTRQLQLLRTLTLFFFFLRRSCRCYGFPYCFRHTNRRLRLVWINSELSDTPPPVPGENPTANRTRAEGDGVLVLPSLLLESPSSAMGEGNYKLFRD